MTVDSFSSKHLLVAPEPDIRASSLKISELYDLHIFGASKVKNVHSFSPRDEKRREETGIPACFAFLVSV